MTPFEPEREGERASKNESESVIDLRALKRFELIGFWVRIDLCVGHYIFAGLLESLIRLPFNPIPCSTNKSHDVHSRWETKKLCR